MKNRFISLAFSCLLLTGCFSTKNNFSKFEEKLGVTMPSKYKTLLTRIDVAIDTSLRYDIYSVEEEWHLDYEIQFQTDFEEEFDLDTYIDAINGYQPLNIPNEYYIPHSDRLDWVCKREEGERRNYESLLIYNEETKLLYALDSTHQWSHQAIILNY